MINSLRTNPAAAAFWGILIIGIPLLAWLRPPDLKTCHDLAIGYGAIAVVVVHQKVGFRQHQMYTLTATDRHGVAYPKMRLITPRECERLQGFPDDYTLIPFRGKPAHLCPDGHRYRALGNSWAIPKIRWIGQRIIEVENTLRRLT